MDRHERERNALMDNEALQPDGSFDGMLMEEMIMEGGRMVKRTRSTETIRNAGNNRDREMKKLSQAMWDDSPAPTPSASTSGSECSSPPRSLMASPKGFEEDMLMDEDDLYMDSKTPASGGEDLRKVWAHAVGTGAGPSLLSLSKPTESVQTLQFRSVLPAQRTPPTASLPPLPASPTSRSSSRSSFASISASASASALATVPVQPPTFSLAEAEAIRDLFSDPEDDSEIDWEEIDDSDSVSVIASDLDGSVAGTSESGSVISSVSGVRSLTSDDEDAEGEDDV